MRKIPIAINQVEVGDRVQFKCGGKVSRLEGMAGKLAWGTIKSIRPEGAVDKNIPDLSIDLDHRKDPNAKYHGMGSVISLDMVLRLEKK